jgi:hypothetical protein
LVRAAEGTAGDGGDHTEGDLISVIPLPHYTEK